MEAYSCSDADVQQRAEQGLRGGGLRAMPACSCAVRPASWPRSQAAQCAPLQQAWQHSRAEQVSRPNPSDIHTCPHTRNVSDSQMQHCHTHALLGTSFDSPYSANSSRSCSSSSAPQPSRRMDGSRCRRQRPMHCWSVRPGSRRAISAQLLPWRSTRPARRESSS